MKKKSIIFLIITAIISLLLAFSGPILDLLVTFISFSVLRYWSLLIILIPLTSLVSLYYAIRTVKDDKKMIAIMVFDSIFIVISVLFLVIAMNI